MRAVAVVSYKEAKGKRKGKDLIEAEIVLGGCRPLCKPCTASVVHVEESACGLDPVAGGLLNCGLLHCVASRAEKEGQRGIIIGRQASALKQLGTAARAEIEEFLGRPVFLSLSVKVSMRLGT
jgi:hypothetical protein